MIHFGNPKTGKTACGKPLARRWWVEPVRIEYGVLAGVLRVMREIRGQASCPECLRARPR